MALCMVFMSIIDFDCYEIHQSKETVQMTIHNIFFVS